MNIVYQVIHTIRIFRPKFDFIELLFCIGDM